MQWLLGVELTGLTTLRKGELVRWGAPSATHGAKAILARQYDVPVGGRFVIENVRLGVEVVKVLHSTSEMDDFVMEHGDRGLMRRSLASCNFHTALTMQPLCPKVLFNCQDDPIVRRC